MKRRKGFKFINDWLCSMFGHKPVFFIESRYHCLGVKVRKNRFGFGGCMKRLNRGNIVRVGYEKCICCGKKLSETRRVY